MHGIPANPKPPQRRQKETDFHRECLLKYIYNEIIFMKCKEQIQATTTINELLTFHINPSKIITGNQKQHETIYYSNLRMSYLA